MNVRKEIKKELGVFVEATAEAYTGIIEPVIASIPDVAFDHAVEQVARAKTRAEDALVKITFAAVEEAFSLMPSEPVDIKSRLIPVEKEIEGELRQVTYLPPPPTQHIPPKASPVLEGEITPPPRLTVEEGGSATMEGPGRADLAAPMGDEFYDPFEPIDHTPPTTTLEQERRMQLGIPTPARPTVHFDGKSRVEQRAVAQKAVTAAASVSAIRVDNPKEILSQNLDKLQKLMMPHIEAKNKDLSMVACSSLVIISECLSIVAGLELAQEDTPEETPEEVVDAEIVDDPK